MARDEDQQEFLSKGTAVFVAQLDLEKYSAICQSTIQTTVVILTDNQRKHIITRRGQAFFDTYSPHFQDVIENPDYIFPDNAHPDTAIATKQIQLDGKHINLVIRLAVEKDSPNKMNSVITAILENEKRHLQRLRNQKAVYKRENL